MVFSPLALAGFFTEILQLQVFVLYMNFTYNGPVSYTHLDVYKRQKVAPSVLNTWAITLPDTIRAISRI